MTIYPFGISEAGKSIVEHSERTQAASTAKSTALLSGIDKIRKALPHHALR
jgi:adenylylsulfate kinase-like enzyme